MAGFRYLCDTVPSNVAAGELSFDNNASSGPVVTINKLNADGVDISTYMNLITASPSDTIIIQKQNGSSLGL